MDEPLHDWTRLERLHAALDGLAALPRHRDYLLRGWTQALPLARGRRQVEHFLPLRARDGWPALQARLDALASLHSAHPAGDGSQRLLVRLHDGQAVESVLLPRGGLCVSTQVGCAVGCVFCRTGHDGLRRQLGSAEIVAQVVLARRLRRVDKVVFMGMGEPAHNLDAVLEAIELLGTCGAVGHKNLVFSTVGDPRVFARLGTGRVRPALALSLHSTDDEQRARLLPRAPRIAVAELVEAAARYAQETGYPLQVQWALIEGVNDRDADVDGLVRLVAGRHAMVNLIPLNAVDGSPLRRPAAARAVEMARALNRRGVLTRLRQSAGQDVEAGCGQLRSRFPVRVLAAPPA